jgi:nitrogen fixation/metabolism regulation signal transduction histidine kinase
VTYILIGSAALGSCLLFLLAAASANTAMFSQHYPLLVALNGALALGLAGLVIYQLVLLARQRRRKVFGSLLTFRVLVMFALVTVVPGALVYTVSVRFLNKSIESWFDVRVDHALEGGLRLGRAALDALLVDMRVKSALMSADLGEMTPAQQAGVIHRMREQVGADDVVLMTARGQVVASASRDTHNGGPPAPSPVVLQQARRNGQYSAVESRDGGLLMRVIVPISNSGLGEAQRFLQLTHPVPASVVEAGENVQTAYNAYKELSLSRESLKDIYIMTLTLTLLLALLGAIALAFLLSRRLSQPLAVLAEGTQAVARGDFSRRAPVTSRDELGILTESFNSMTEQLDDARHAAEKQRAQLQTANAYLENILANLSAGVLVFDASFALRVANRGAGGILHEDMDQVMRLPLGDWPRLTGFAATVLEEFGAHGVGRGRAPRRARDQEPADAHPARRGAAGSQARAEARAGGRNGPVAGDRHHSDPGGGAEEHGRRVPRVRAPAHAAPRGARPERAGAGCALPLRGIRNAPGGAAGARSCPGDRRPQPAAPGHPQPAPERPGCAFRDARAAH